MIKMTTELFNKFSTKQEELDSMIREKFGISDDEWKHRLDVNHSIALQTEVSEFINECHDLWKYWKQKAVVPERIIDEAIDIIHFMHLIHNKSDVGNRKFVNKLNHFIEVYDKLKPGKEYVLYNLNSEIDYPEEKYAKLLYILDHYAFTLEDIEKAYDKKWNENHARQQRNY
ncbi:hypothetical protein GTN30_06375 [Macrococcoides canis]|uniref:dUTPase n=1 Tax=Macrococcoides canis TaxID=1855823 RepID=A0AAE6X1K4_9STAP|nr:dUTP diphosphatase [Macrococcus canis]QIH78293.1 hypothetical protein GTN30_06375 [Macrococcus canis]